MNTAMALPGDTDSTFLTHLLAPRPRGRALRGRALPSDGRWRHPPLARRREDGEGPPRCEARDGLAEGRPGAAAHAQRDHRVHRPAHQERRGRGLSRRACSATASSAERPSLNVPRSSRDDRFAQRDRSSAMSRTISSNNRTGARSSAERRATSPVHTPTAWRFLRATPSVGCDLPDHYPPFTPSPPTAPRF